MDTSVFSTAAASERLTQLVPEVTLALVSWLKECSRQTKPNEIMAASLQNTKKLLYIVFSYIDHSSICPLPGPKDWSYSAVH